MDDISAMLKQQIVDDDEYEMARLVEPFRGTFGTVLDIGAHHGWFSRHLLTHWPEATCHCYEPISENSDQIPDDFSLIVYTAAVSAGERTLDLRLHGNSGMWSALKIKPEAIEERTVQAVDFRGVLERFESVDILKMDVEGYESRLIRYAGDWLDRVKVFVLEDHFGKGGPLLESLGFRLWYRAYGSGAHPIYRR